MVRIMDGKAVFNFAALEGPKQKIRAVQEKLKADTQLEKAKLVEYCGIVLGSVKELSTFEIHGESKTDKGARRKNMNKRFRLKLERIKKSLEGGKHSLATSEGAGILMCNALAAAGRTVWEGGETATSDWIREKCIGEKHSIFEFKKEMECDFCPSVEIKPDNSVTLTVGEAKANIEARGDATKQMQEQVRLLVFGLWFIFGDTIKAETIVKKGHFYVLEAEADHQGLEDTVEEDGLSITVHKMGN